MIPFEAREGSSGGINGEQQPNPRLFGHQVHGEGQGFQRRPHGVGSSREMLNDPVGESNSGSDRHRRKHRTGAGKVVVLPYGLPRCPHGEVHFRDVEVASSALRTSSAASRMRSISYGSPGARCNQLRRVGPDVGGPSRESLWRNKPRFTTERNIAAFIGAEPHERTASRSNQRNGSRARTLTTIAGNLELRIP